MSATERSAVPEQKSPGISRGFIRHHARWLFV